LIALVHSRSQFVNTCLQLISPLSKPFLGRTGRGACNSAHETSFEQEGQTNKSECYTSFDKKIYNYPDPVPHCLEYKRQQDQNAATNAAPNQPGPVQAGGFTVICHDSGV
jgi:hypothetical protein